MTEQELDLLRSKSIDQLTDDELELLADRGLRLQSEQASAEFEYSQRLAFLHFRSVLRSLGSEGK